MSIQLSRETLLVKSNYYTKYLYVSPTISKKMQKVKNNGSSGIEELYCLVDNINYNIKTPDEFKELRGNFTKKSEMIQRYYYHNKDNIDRYDETIFLMLAHDIYTYTEYDDKITISMITYSPKINNKVYFRVVKKQGFTYNKKTKKIEFWFGTNIRNIDKTLIDLFLLYNGCEWVLQIENYRVHGLITKTVLEHIFNRKITNEKFLIKKYLSISVKYNYSHKLVKKLLKWEDRYIMPSFIGSNSITALLITIKNNFVSPENTLRQIVNKELGYDYLIIINDMIKHNEILDFKINTNWSLKRLNEEHLKNNRKITQLMIEMGHISNDDIEGLTGELRLPEGASGKLITNELEAYNESSEQNNCVYNSYWSSMKDRKYFVLSIDKPERCSVGIRVTPQVKEHVYIEQIYAASNRVVDMNTTKIFSDWIKEDDIKNFFLNNVNDSIKKELVSQTNNSDDNVNTSIFELENDPFTIYPTIMAI